MAIRVAKRRDHATGVCPDCGGDVCYHVCVLCLLNENRDLWEHVGKLNDAIRKAAGDLSQVRGQLNDCSRSIAADVGELLDPDMLDVGDPPQREDPT